MSAVMTPLGRVDRQPNLRTGRREIWYAESADGYWAYERLETAGTPWVVVFRPTGQEEWFTSLPKARKWTASDALRFLRARAQDVVDRAGADPGRVGPPDDDATCAERVAQAQQQIDVLDRLLDEDPVLAVAAAAVRQEAGFGV